MAKSGKRQPMSRAVRKIELTNPVRAGGNGHEEIENAMSKTSAGKPATIRLILWCGFIVALAAVAAPALSAAQAANDTRIVPRSVSQAKPTAADCETRMQKLDASQAEGEERLAEKYRVIDFCDTQYRNDRTIQRLVKECAKYVEQPVVKQQFTADCQLAAFSYANALYALKAEYRK
ncbi:MAG: hypothetical protein WBD48_07370 [Pseudolabrys sp.]